MKRAGCVEIQIGIESGNDKILASLAKCRDKNLIAEKIRLVRKYGINTWGTFIIGHMGETPSSIADTIAFAKKADPTYSSFIILLPFPGTRAYEQFKAKGYLKTTNWDDYTWHGDPVFELPELSKQDLIRYRALAQKSFYLRPAKLVRLAIQTILSGSLREMLRNFYAWMSVIKLKK
jgi:anaerobic magnesium-protoporphyrin IX monomethyl ester cyclase